MTSPLLTLVLVGLFSLSQVISATAQEPAPATVPATPRDPVPPAVAAQTNEPALAVGTASPETPATPKAPASRRSRRTSRSNRNDFVIVGAPVNVRSNETVHEVVAVGSQVRVEGTVESQMVVVLGKTTLGPSARVGELVIVGGTFDADPGAHLGQNPVIISPDAMLAITNVVPMPIALATRDWIKTGLLQMRPLPWPHQSGWAWVIAAFCLLAYALVEVLIPKSVQSTVTALEEKPGSAFLVGLLGTLFTLPVLGLLLISVVGAVVIPFLLCALIGMLVLGKASLYRHAGSALAARLRAPWLASPLPALVVGAVGFYILYSVPVFGGIVWVLVAPMAFGAVLLAALGRSKSIPREATPAVNDPPALAGWIPGRRAGFWLRLMATLLDGALVLLVLGIVLHRMHWFLPIWLLYHLLFWIGQGTTVGGIICGLRIVRLDGRPLSAGMAIVRLLGSVFSLAVAGLGFFWAGWSASKQSWHDKIAGTVIVRETHRTATNASGPTMQPAN